MGAPAYGVILERQDNTKEGVTAGATDHGTKNPNLRNKAFRKAISYMIDNEGAVGHNGRFVGNAVAL